MTIAAHTVYNMSVNNFCHLEQLWIIVDNELWVYVYVFDTYVLVIHLGEQLTSTMCHMAMMMHQHHNYYQLQQF